MNDVLYSLIVVGEPRHVQCQSIKLEMREEATKQLTVFAMMDWGAVGEASETFCLGQSDGIAAERLR